MDSAFLTVKAKYVCDLLTIISRSQDYLSLSDVGEVLSAIGTLERHALALQNRDINSRPQIYFRVEDAKSKNQNELGK